ncbi:phosphate ABC transporter permease PstA [Dactylosporangium siamense]|uniref:Phosphate transport system permease protein PstA n=1 Tax=Dactylosporangium siamense TaxID=685454 RepID=A0A919PJ01_9ACTN|nr:phosphate ABC transporter permease PstA [Dactylosporangium siamense]GIG43073.1 phosphate transport system permease protein PstA [Dactylosporangium siamense]
MSTTSTSGTRTDAAAATKTDPSAPERPRRLRARTLDDKLSLLGATAGSLALTWVLYGKILPFSGLVGFLIVWYVVFLLMYATVTSLSSPRPVVVDRVAGAVVMAGAGVVAVALLSTVFYTLVRGVPVALHWNFFTKDMSGVRPTAPMSEGGILHALAGSAVEIGIGVLISLPLGVVTAVYMVEVGGRLSKVVRTVVEAMTAVPDILAGLFVYTTLVVGLGWPKSGLAAGLAIAVTMVPIIARASDVVLRVVPGGLREAGLALGASQWQVVRHVVLPTARPGLATALILGVARGIGETAPVLITSGASTFLNLNPTENTMNSLPLFIFIGVRSGQPQFIDRGFGAAAVLLTVVLLLFSLARWLARPKV